MVLSPWLCWECSILWHQHTLIMQCLDQLLCRWDWTAPMLFPKTSLGNAPGDRHLHCRMLACSWKTLVMLASRRALRNDSDPQTKYYLYFLLFFCSMCNPWIYIELRKKYVPAFCVAPITLLQSLVKVTVPAPSVLHQSQSGMRFSLKSTGLASGSGSLNLHPHFHRLQHYGCKFLTCLVGSWVYSKSHVSCFEEVKGYFDCTVRNFHWSGRDTWPWPGSW